jgi:hypothetical protein
MAGGMGQVAEHMPANERPQVQTQVLPKINCSGALFVLPKQTNMLEITTSVSNRECANTLGYLKVNLFEVLFIHTSSGMSSMNLSQRGKNQVTKEIAFRVILAMSLQNFMKENN